MSLESLQALKSLVQVREQGASAQNDNLENIQRNVQQLGTSEATRVDTLHLDTAKAQYEVALTYARMERLQSQLMRENAAVNDASTIAVVAGGLSLLSNIKYVYDDFTNKTKLGDSENHKNGNLNNFKFNEQNGGTSVDLTPGSAGGRVTKTSAQNANGDQAAVFANFNSQGSVGKDPNSAGGRVTGVAIIKQADIAAAAAEYNIKNPNNKITADSNGHFTLEDLQAKDPKAFQALITANSSDVLRNETGTFLDAFGTKTKGSGTDNEISFAKNLNISDTREGLKFDLSIKDRVEDYSKKVGETKGGFDSAMDKGKSIYNALVRMADDVSPFYQAYLKMKDKRDNTADELNAEIAKLAAERKKLKALEQAIQSPGAGEEGSGSGEAAKSKS